MRPLLVFCCTTLASIAFQIGLATGHFKQYAWAMPWLYIASAFFGILWLVSHPKVRFLFGVNDRQKLPQTDTMGVKDSFQQAQTVGDIRTGDVHVHLPESIPQVRMPQPLPAKHIPPTVECVRTRTIRITSSGRYGECLSESTIIDSHDPQAVVAYFRNVPSKGTDDHPDIYGVQAQIIYRDINGDEIQDVPKGSWLDSGGISIHFPLNDTQGLILMILVHDTELRAPYQGGYKTFAIGQVETIDVCLTSHNSGRNRVLLSKTFRWIDEDGHIDAVILPP